MYSHKYNGECADLWGEFGGMRVSADVEIRRLLRVRVFQRGR